MKHLITASRRNLLTPRRASTIRYALDSGMVLGTTGTNPDVTVFKGLPFAAPPVGELRWRAPKPVAPWNGVRKADEFGPMCMQAAGRGGQPRR